MTLRDTDLATLAMVKAGLTLNHKDGTLLVDDAGELSFFTAQIAPGHHLYIEFQNEWTVAMNVGVFRRPREHMKHMIRANYAGLRIMRDSLGLPGEEGDFVKPLTPRARQAYEADSARYCARDRDLQERYGIEF